MAESDKGKVPRKVSIEKRGVSKITGYSVKCSRIKANGDQCRSWAVQGSSICAKHGGMAPKTKANGMFRREQAKVERMVEKMRDKGLLRSAGEELHPLVHLLQELYLSAGVVKALGEMVGDLEDVSQSGGVDRGREEHVVYRLWSEERERHARLAQMCLKAGVAERQIRIAEQQAEQVASAIRGILHELGVAQDPRAPAIVRRHLLLLAPSTSDTPDKAESILAPSPAGSPGAMSEADKNEIRGA